TASAARAEPTAATTRKNEKNPRRVIRSVESDRNICVDAGMTRKSPTNRSSRKAPAQSSKAAAKLPSRTTTVWVSFVAAMTLVGGMLLLVDGRPSPRMDGFSLSPLAATGPTSIAESITQTQRPLDTDRWQAIVIHHSGAMWGSNVSIAAEHEAMGFKGLGH